MESNNQATYSMSNIELKNEIIKLMDGMFAFRKKYPKFDFPKPSDEFILAKELLSKGEFNLAVCGKVKNGKSSLINALIGKELLPVCNDVATSRVFKISSAAEEKFYVVYANGSRKEISQKELSCYGNQAVIDEKGEKDVNESIAYIQVYTPMDFLPEGVSLVDTPGIGSTYPQHTSITKQYIKMTDAALFVMNPTPLEKIEVDFLKEVVKVTPGVIFVTTKTDQNGNDSVEKAIERNRQIIETSVGTELPFGVSMLKMSSSLLLEAAKADNEVSAQFNYEISGYSDVKTAINKIVFTILGYYRAGIAYNACVNHYKEVLNVLQLRKDKVEISIKDYHKLLADYEAALANFNQTMGENRRKEVVNQVELILKTMEGDFNQIFSSKGHIYTTYENEIEALNSYNAASYGENLGERIVSDIQSEWDNLTALVQSKVGEILTTFNNECMMSIPSGLISINSDGVQDPTIKDVQLRDRIGKMRNEMFLGTALTGALSTVVGSTYFFLPALVTPALPVVAPVLVILGLGSVLWGAISGNKKAKQETLKKNKDQLTKFVSDTISNCRKQIVETSLADNKYQSLYHGFLAAVREQVNNSITTIYNRYKEELEAMKKLLEEAKQNPQLLPAIEHLIKEWTAKKETILLIHDKLESIKPN